MRYEHLNPAVTVDMIIDYAGEGIVFVTRRKEPYKGCLALPGGFVETNRETLEHAASREVLEETLLRIAESDWKLLGVYSDPKRDPRGHAISVVFYAYVDGGALKAGDDAADIAVLKKIPDNMAFDHRKIVEDYYERFGTVMRT